MRLPERKIRKPGDQWCVAREPRNPKVVGPVVWSWYRCRWSARRARDQLNAANFSWLEGPHSVLSAEELDARWNAVNAQFERDHR